MITSNTQLLALIISCTYIVGTFVVGKILIHFLTERAVRPLIAKSKKAKVERKRETITKIFRLAGNIILYTAVLIMILRLFGITTTSLLTGAGVTGLIFGLGAQSLLKDILAGLFILGEDHFDIGDLVEIGSVRGKIVDATIRSVIIETSSGHTAYIPHGTITHIINHTRKRG